MEPYGKVKVALAQVAPKMGDVEGNFGKIIDFVDRSVSQGADVVVFPELATAGYLSQGIFFDVAEKSNPNLVRVADAAKGISVVLGLVEEDDMGNLYNAAMVLRDGQIVKGKWMGKDVTSYRKLYLPTYGMFEESRWFAPGSSVPIYDLESKTGRFRAGVVICEDYWQPLSVRIAAMRGAQVVFAIASSPKTLQKPKMTHSLLVARAIENALYVVFVNQAGSQDMVNFWGGSEVIDFEGNSLVTAPLREEALVFADLDLYRERKYREVNPMLREERGEVIEDYARAFKEMREGYPRWNRRIIFKTSRNTHYRMSLSSIGKKPRRT
ncbi:MAG: nitrilase-related carbon-nitrogen hydrolase [Candidatus Marsarchaeota archaeon]